MKPVPLSLLVLFSLGSLPLLALAAPEANEFPEKVRLEFLRLHSLAISAAQSGEHTEARRFWLEASKLDPLPPRERSEALIRLAGEHAAETDVFTASNVAEDVLKIPEASPETRTEAWLLVARAYSLYGNPNAWVKVRAACQNILALPEISSTTRTATLQLSVPAFLALRAYTEAAQSQHTLAGDPSIPALDRAQYLLGLARTFLIQRNFDATRTTLSDFTSRLALIAHEASQEPLFQDLRAEAQLLHALTFYDAGALELAREELEKIPSMPGQSASSRQTREARLRSHLKKWAPQEEPVLKVLFIGSSHTLCGNIPLLVEQIAASAPAGSPRIAATEQARMGTGMRVHWNEGEAPDTARGKIAAEPWDVVVVETFYRMPREDMQHYGELYSNFAQKSGARLLIYEAPVAKVLPYPAGYRDFHDSNIWLGKRLQAPVAPSVRAWMNVLGPETSEAGLQRLYFDGTHANDKGAYLTACTLYAALTERSPVGLYVPTDLLSKDEALSYQNAAWAAYEETRARVSPDMPGKLP